MFDDDVDDDDDDDDNGEVLSTLPAISLLHSAPTYD